MLSDTLRRLVVPFPNGVSTPTRTRGVGERLPRYPRLFSMRVTWAAERYGDSGECLNQCSRTMDTAASTVAMSPVLNWMSP